uniref:Rho guanine nucleotide exchange factor 28 n=1 Tax=Calidris pygmaea TaxID=425635 RepID=A0A8C3PKB1_9CHAR
GDLTCSYLPKAGQVTINAKFDKDIYLPEDAEFYFVYDGSLKRHVMFAERISDNALRSIVPAHGCQEAVSVSVLMYTRGYSPVVLGSSPVTYRENLSCKLSRFLVDHAESVTAASHKMLLDKFGLRIKDLQSLDNDLMMAVAHEELPSTWNILGSCSEEPKHKETLLHLVMKLGLVKLSQFLAAQPGGSSALALPNEDGATPLDLALQNGHSRLVEVFTNFQGSHSLDISRAEISEGACMQFVHSSGALTLTFSHTAQHLLESDIKLFRKYFWDRPLLYQVLFERKRNPEEGYKDQRHSTLDVLRKLKAPPTLFAATRHSAVLSGNDEVYANCMVVDQVSLWSNFGQIFHCLLESCLNPTNSIPMAKSSSSPSLEENDQCIYVPNEGNQRPVKNGENAGLRHAVSPSDLEGADSYLPFKTHGFIKDRGQLNADMKKKRYGIDLMECTVSGIRSRSYSCSSPKGLLGRPRIPRDFAVGDSNEERAYSLPEQSREKRIQEEEWNKYIVPSKNESEKCKVSRTFSFLMNRMTSTRNKCKTKNKDTKDKEKLNRHNFTNGTFSGVIPCMACEKALLGKESLQCSHCNVIVHKNCKEYAPVCTKVTFYSLPGDISQAALAPVHPSSSVPIGLSAGQREASQQSHFLSKSVPSASFERRSIPFSEQDSETSTWRSKSRSEEMLQALGTFSSMDPFVMEDDVDLPQWTDLRTDAQEFEAESWSLVVDPVFCSKQEKDVIKRQDVIFELMQTEVHHIHTLFIMSEIFRKGMKEELQLDHSTVDKIFPCLDELLEMHRQFFCRMKERRQESCEAGSERNFVISRIGDILVQQFSEENATKMKKIYGEFCSHQKEAVNLFKELQQNKKFQNFIKLRNSNLLARRRGIPECILLVTQRITKYPVLVERILQYSKEGTEERKDLCKALHLIKDMIAAVDLKVNEYEKKQKLLEILSRTENKTYTKLKNGHVFRNPLTLYLQITYEYCLLIVREVANEERGMFLISASSAGPEMYEVHTNSKEERNNWMRHIQDAVESCPEEEEEGKVSESDEDRRIAEAKASRIQKCQESLSNQDQQICSYLEEKLHIYAELGDMSGFEDVHVEPHLLIKPDSGETPQAASLLAAALREGEFAWEEWTADSSYGEVIQGNRVQLACIIVQAIQNLTRLLYSIQAAVAIQDSHTELHRLLLQDNEKTCRGHGSRLNLLLEQEKYRNLEKQRVEVANIHKLKQQFQQEQQRWLRECEQRQREQEAREGQLGQRERECGYQEELLEKSRQELALQLQEYQQSLERLQEGQKMVERERDSVRMQKRLLWHWKHGQQSSVLSSSESYEIMRHSQLDSLRGENAFYLNEAVVCVSLSSLNRSDSSLVYEDGVYGLNISNSDVVRTSENQVDLKTDNSCQPVLTSALWKSTGPYQQMSFSCKSNKDAFNDGYFTAKTSGTMVF